MRIVMPVKIISLDTNSFHLFITAEISGIERDILIDTGASRTVFDKQYILENDTFIVDSDLHSAGIGAEPLDIFLGQLPCLRIGMWEIYDMPAAGMDLSQINEWYSRFTQSNIAALMGSDFLLKYKAIINYSNSSISFSFPKRQMRQ